MRLRGVAGLAAVVMAAAACTGDGGGDGGGGGPLAGQQVEVAATWTGSEQEGFRAVLDAFEEETGAEARFTSTGDDIGAVLGPRIEGGDPPEIAMLPQPGLLRDYVDQGVLTALDDIVGDVAADNFAPIWQDLATIDGTLYGQYWKASSKSTMWYNATVFEDAGVETPTDFDGLLSTGQTISDFGVPPYSFGAGDGWTLTDIFENIYLRVAGPEGYDQLTNHEIPWTDQSVKDSLEVFGQLVENPDLLAGGVDGALQTDFNTSVTQAFADPPEAAIVAEPLDVVGGIAAEEAGAEVGTTANFFDFPSVEGSGTAVVAGGDVAVLLEDTEAARSLLEFLATPEAAEVRVGIGGFVSPNQNVDFATYPDDIIRGIAESLVTAADEGNLRFDMSDLQPAEFGATTGQGLWGEFQEFVRDPSDVDGVTERLEDAATQAFG